MIEQLKEIRLALNVGASSNDAESLDKMHATLSAAVSELLLSMDDQNACHFPMSRIVVHDAPDGMIVDIHPPIHVRFDTEVLPVRHLDQADLSDTAVRTVLGHRISSALGTLSTASDLLREKGFKGLRAIEQGDFSRQSEPDEALEF